MSDAPLLEVRGVAKRFGRRRVLADVSLTVGRGELVGVTGENGAGRSTLLRIVAGWLRPDAGAVTRRGRLGFCPQDPLAFERLTVAENVAYFAAAYGLADWRGPMDGLFERFRFAAHARTLVRDLSAGTRQKLNLALALLPEPELLVLDEPYAGFDWETYLHFWEEAAALRARGCGLLVVAHIVHERARLDRLCELRDGRLACA